MDCGCLGMGRLGSHLCWALKKKKKSLSAAPSLNLFKLYFANPSLGSHCELVIPLGLRAVRRQRLPSRGGKGLCWPCSCHVLCGDVPGCGGLCSAALSHSPHFQLPEENWVTAGVGAGGPAVFGGDCGTVSVFPSIAGCAHPGCWGQGGQCCRVE